MANLKDIRKRIVSVKSIQQITKAMKMVAAARLRKAMAAITKVRPYSLKLNEIISLLSESVEELTDHPLYNVRPLEKVLVITVTSDTGLCGAYNSSVIKQTVDYINKNYPSDEEECQVDLICIGKKGYDHFRKKDYNVVESYIDLLGKMNFMKVEEMATGILKQFSDKEYDEIKFIYNQFKNAAVYNTTTEQFLPIAFEKTAIENEITTTSVPYLLLEPTREEIIEELIPKSLKIYFYKLLLEAHASEHGARMTAMENATENASQLLNELSLTYNKERQASITKELLEIVSGSNALSQE